MGSAMVDPQSTMHVKINYLPGSTRPPLRALSGLEDNTVNQAMLCIRLEARDVDKQGYELHVIPSPFPKDTEWEAAIYKGRA